MDKSAIDLAGVEAGAKIFVPEEAELFGSLAHAVTADQNRSCIVCARGRMVEGFLNIDISLSPAFAISPCSYSKARKILTARNSIK
jgi:hypothetical protein